MSTTTHNPVPPAGVFVPDGDGRPGGKRDLIARYIADTVRDTAPTPIARVTTEIAGVPRTILLKLEGRSRWGSIKGRTALALLGSVADRVDGSTTIVESTSGNLGVALAGMCGELGIALTAVVDAQLPPVASARITGYGGMLVRVERTDDGLGLQRRIAMVREIVQSNPAAVWTNQYENPANVAVHRWWTGPELGAQVGPLHAVFAPVSTGGSFAGLRDYLAAERPDVACVAVDVHGSTIFGGDPGHRLLTGIGASRPSAFIGDRVDQPHVMVSDVDSIAVCRTLLADTGIGVGGSSGATIAGAVRALADRPELTVVLCQCPDSAGNYAQTLYDDGWLARSGIGATPGRAAVDGHPIRFAAHRATTQDSTLEPR